MKGKVNIPPKYNIIVANSLGLFFVWKGMLFPGPSANSDLKRRIPVERTRVADRPRILSALPPSTPQLAAPRHGLLLPLGQCQSPDASTRCFCKCLAISPAISLSDLFRQSRYTTLGLKTISTYPSANFFLSNLCSGPHGGCGG